MKKIIVVLLCLPMIAGAQSLIGGKNIFRWNIGSVALKNYHFTYERSLTKRLSASISYRTMAKGAMPLQDELAKKINSSSVDFNNFQMGNTAWTLEGRFYLGMGRMKGFYLAPYLRFANFDLSAPVKYTVTTGPAAGASKQALFSGNVKSTSPGLLIGWQFTLVGKLVMDLQIIGGHYGHSSGDLNFAAALNSDEVSALQTSINDIKNKTSPFTVTGTASSTGAKITTDGPWFGVRSNIGIGLRF